MKKKLLLLMSFVATTMAFAQELPDAITNSLQMYAVNRTELPTKPVTYRIDDALIFSGADALKSKAFWGVDADSKTHFTLEFWFSMGAQSGQQELMSITGAAATDANKNGIRIRTAPKNGFFIYINNKSCAMVDYPGANPGANPIIPRDEWHHIAITYNAGKLKLYYDGEPMQDYNWTALNGQGKTLEQALKEVTTRPILDTYLTNQTTLEPTDAENGYFVVQAPNHDLGIADIRYWNKTLGAGTIKEWYNKYVTSSHPNYANLQHNWKMNEKYDLGDGKFSIPDRGKLGLTGLVNTEDMSKYPIFNNEEDVVIVPTGIATAKTLNAAFVVNEESREITVTAEKLDGTQKITIFDAQGKAIYHAFETAHGGTLTVAAPQTAGLYFVQIGEGSSAFVGKVALTR
ncbi:LamG-like jellyroll fold domain-containing protein [Bacteroides nordii]|uniref:LamG-like jellyroll fold domain-containing protein n=1 Tax=Bacteroides nordii TaxID=291645 RepID=UPI0026DDC241|nr:LamG-like jellyroll fold domain-containing protein [Bacteroides nordii]